MQHKLGAWWHSLVENICFKKHISSNRTTFTYGVILVVARTSTQCGGITGTANVGGYTWNVGVQSYGYCMELTTASFNYTGSTSLSDIGAYLISIGELSPNDMTIYYSVEFRGGGLGMYSLTLSRPTPPAIKYLSNGILALGNWTFQNLQYVPDPFTTDYSNVTYSSSAVSLNALSVNFLYTRNALNVFVTDM